MRNKIISFGIVIFMAVQCATVPLTGRKQFSIIPASQIMALSSDSYNQILKENKISTNAQYNNTVKKVGRNISGAVERYFASKKKSDLLNGYAWEYNVLQSKEVNAFCLPGGKIAFYEGIMPVCVDESGVAVVMSHEVSHAIANHGNERMSEQMAVQLGGMALDAALSQKPDATRQIAAAAFVASVDVAFALALAGLALARLALALGRRVVPSSADRKRVVALVGARGLVVGARGARHRDVRRAAREQRGGEEQGARQRDGDAVHLIELAARCDPAQVQGPGLASVNGRTRSEAVDRDVLEARVAAIGAEADQPPRRSSTQGR